MQYVKQYLDCQDGHNALTWWPPWRFPSGWWSILLVSTPASARVTNENNQAIEAGMVPLEMPWWRFQVP